MEHIPPSGALEIKPHFDLNRGNGCEENDSLGARIRSGWGTWSLSCDEKSTGEMGRMEEVHKKALK